jgi:hypothetical protein
MDDDILDAEILRLLQAYGAAAIPVDHIAPAIGLRNDGAVQRVEERLISLAEEGLVRRSRVFPDRWLVRALTL